MPSGPSQRILVRGVNWLGDAVMSTPALLRLREARPGAHIALLTPEKLEGLWPGHPAVDAVHTFAPGESAWRVGRRLRAERFDLGLALPNSPRSAFELWLAGIPQRVGFARPWRNWLLTTRVPPRAEAVAMHKRSASEINRLIHGPVAAPEKIPSVAHHVHQYLHLAAALGAKPEPLPPLLSVSAGEVDACARKFNLPARADGSRLLFALSPGAEYGPAKRWPVDCFTAAAARIHERTGCGWVLLGGPGDVAVGEAIASAWRLPESAFRNLAGRTSLRELCAALKLCRVLLTNDSGPMHAAAALGTPVVALFGSTSPELTGPGLPGDARHVCLRADVPCSPCFLRECPIDFRCMTGITVDQVVEAVLKAAA